MPLGPRHHSFTSWPAGTRSTLYAKQARPARYSGRPIVSRHRDSLFTKERACLPCSAGNREWRACVCIEPCTCVRADGASMFATPQSSTMHGPIGRQYNAEGITSTGTWAVCCEIHCNDDAATTTRQLQRLPPHTKQVFRSSVGVVGTDVLPVLRSRLGQAARRQDLVPGPRHELQPTLRRGELESTSVSPCDLLS